MNLSVQTGIRPQAAGVGGTLISAADQSAVYNLLQGASVSDAFWLAMITGFFGMVNGIIAAYVALAVRGVHTIVNQRQTDMVNEIKELREALLRKG